MKSVQLFIRVSPGMAVGDLYMLDTMYCLAKLFNVYEISTDMDSKTLSMLLVRSGKILADRPFLT